jgi:hypothetical protein
MISIDQKSMLFSPFGEVIQFDFGTGKVIEVCNNQL